MREEEGHFGVDAAANINDLLRCRCNGSVNGVVEHEGHDSVVLFS